ncbi:MAG: T9SS type A sorting domain-containing protein, partial [Candidatus Kapaibacterium sp.]
LGYIDFLRLPHETDCNFINFDSISLSDPCSASQVFQFNGIIGSSSLCDGVLSVGEEQNSTDIPFTFSPNPANDFGTIYAKNYSGPLLLGIYDNNGRLIRTIDGEISPDEGLRFSLTNLAAGSYTLRIHSQSGTHDIKIIINR